MNLPFLLRLHDDKDRRAKLEQDLIRREAEIGGELFGPLPAGHKRRFFCLDEYTWVWYEEWTVSGRRQSVTTRYDVRPGVIVKSQDGIGSQPLSYQEARHLRQAVQLYRERVTAEYQQLAQAT